MKVFWLWQWWQEVPILAESYNMSADGKTVTLLRQGVKGMMASLTSADVKFTILKCSRKHPRGPNSFREVKSIDNSDAHTAIFNLENLHRTWCAHFLHTPPMVPKHLLKVRMLNLRRWLTNLLAPTFQIRWMKKGQYIRLIRMKIIAAANSILTVS